MEKGSKEISCAAGATITVRASAEFCVYAMEKKKRIMILGPLSANARILRYKLPPDIERVYIKTEKSTEWTIDWSFFTRSENLDITPVELPIGYQEPESLASQMRRFIKDEVSKQAIADNLGSFEEEDDFELEDVPLTNYEMTDMQEVDEIDWHESSSTDEKEPDKGEDPPKEDAKSEAPEPVAEDNEAK